MKGIMIPDYTNEQLLEVAQTKTKEMVTVNSDVWFRQQLVEEMKKRNIEFNYDKILRGKVVSFSTIK
jgi:hypothetical protein